MALLGSNIIGEVGLRLLLCPHGSNVVIRTTCCSVGIALPVYSTFKAIENRDQNAQHRCLLYWAAYGSFSLIEVFTDKHISWFPMYYHLKLAFLVWLQLPSTNGAKQLYGNLLRPFLLRHQAKVDQVGLRLLLCPLGSNVVVRTACCSVGIALPVYSTFKAIENRDQDAQNRCLLYWAAYGSFSLIEVFTDKLISWFPMYYHLKFAFLVWLQLPYTSGAKQLYVNHLRPFLLRHQARIDQVLGHAYSEVIKLVNSHQTEIQFVRSMVVKITHSANQMLRGPTESNRSLQHNPADNELPVSDAEPDQNNNRSVR